MEEEKCKECGMPMRTEDDHCKDDPTLCKHCCKGAESEEDKKM